MSQIYDIFSTIANIILVFHNNFWTKHNFTKRIIRTQTFQTAEGMNEKSSSLAHITHLQAWCHARISIFVTQTHNRGKQLHFALFMRVTLLPLPVNRILGKNQQKLVAWKISEPYDTKKKRLHRKTQLRHSLFSLPSREIQVKFKTRNCRCCWLCNYKGLHRIWYCLLRI